MTDQMSEENGATMPEENNPPEENLEQLADSPEAASDETLEANQVVAEESEPEAVSDPEPEEELEVEAELPADSSSAATEDQSTNAVATQSAPLDEAEEEPEQPAVIEEPDDGRAWYVLHCYSGYENKVRHNLEQRIETMGMKETIFDVVVPTEEEIEVKEGKRKTVERRVFPGYILVNMVLSEDSWYVVRNTPGVTSFVGQGNEPLPLRPEEVATIIKRMEADAPRIKVTFKQGERVRIVDGPFNDFRGTVDEIDMERAKVRVMVNFFGRETPVELDFLQVEKA
jgi:transcriptional antiterminator NusG